MAPVQARGQVHALMAPRQDRGRNISVESLVFLFDHPVHTLFNSGASHSFIFDSVVESLHLSTSIFSDPVIVSNPIGGTTHLFMI